ncbi:hypothetical protein HYY75_00745 [bacterium]|nr:hypothetical protein [bacterium]
MAIKNKTFGYLFLLIALVVAGCGGGGGGGGGSTGTGTTQTATISGDVTAPEINDSLLASLRSATGGNINFSNLTIQVSGDDTTKVQVTDKGKFTITLKSLTSRR